MCAARPETPLFIATRGQLLGQPLGDRQVHRIFDQLRRQLGWVGRGAHGVPRIHDLRHSFAVRRLLLWHQQGVDMRPADAGAVDLPRPRQGLQHLLVPHRRAGADGHRRQALRALRRSVGGLDEDGNA